jgi:hypothetical protein
MRQNFSDIGGASLLLHKYQGSMFAMLSAVFPEFDWLPWKFPQVPKTYWDNVNNVRKYLNWVGNQLGIKELKDWYQVDQKVS